VRSHSDGTHAVDRGDDRRSSTNGDADTRPELLTDPTKDRATDRRTAEKHDRLQGQHPAAHRWIGTQLHDGRRRRHEGDAANADEDADRVGERHVRGDCQ